MTIHELNETRKDLELSKQHLEAVNQAIRQSPEVHDAVVKTANLNVSHVLNKAIKDIDGYIGVIDRFARKTSIDFPGTGA